MDELTKVYQSYTKNEALIISRALSRLVRGTQDVETSLRELAALIKGCSFYISADTGPLHFAAALKKPLIAMYGPTKADRTGPYGSKNSTVLLSPAKCAGCLKKKCDNWHCMHDITPDMVYKIYQEKVAEG